MFMRGKANFGNAVSLPRLEWGGRALRTIRIPSIAGGVKHAMAAGECGFAQWRGAFDLAVNLDRFTCFQVMANRFGRFKCAALVIDHFSIRRPALPEPGVPETWRRGHGAETVQNAPILIQYENLRQLRIEIGTGNQETA